MNEQSEKPSKKKIIQAVVTSDKMNKTFVAMSKTRVRHAEYGKVVFKRRKYKVHDEVNQAKEGDVVLIIESRPRSKEKRWASNSIIEVKQNTDVKEVVA